MTAAPGFAEHFAGNRYFDRRFATEAVKVLPGEYYAASGDMLLVTVLGSCVAACLRDRDTGIGGMNHFMLAGDDGSTLSPSARYGAYAMEILINHLQKLGASRAGIEAKVFGGARVMEALSHSGVGDRNAQFVIDYLHREGIPVVAQDLLDVHPRKVYFFPASGRVLVRRLARLHNDTLARREQEYAARLGGVPVSGDIELFT